MHAAVYAAFLLVLSGGRCSHICNVYSRAISVSGIYVRNRTEPCALKEQIMLTLPVQYQSGIRFDVSNNTISKIPTGLFTNRNRRYNITILFLHKNIIEFIPRHAFDGLYWIQYIFLYDNNIHTLSDGAFERTSVVALYLFSNSLSYIHGNPFPNDNISEIHLYSNEIQNVSASVIMGLNNNATIFMSCQFLAETPWAPNYMTIKCANPSFVPTIHFNTFSIPLALREEGFSCNITNRGESECHPCPPGTFGNGINGCTACPAGGFYQDEIGQTSSYRGGMNCKSCNIGTFVTNGSGEAINDCHVCPEGTNQSQPAGFRACFCKKDYTRDNRFQSCALCQEEGLNCTFHEFKALLPGYYWNWSFPSANIKTYQQFTKNLEDESRFYDEKYINYTHEIPKVYKCPRFASCSNNHSYTSERIAGSCGHGYMGWLCSKCQEGYFMVLNTCVLCPEKLWFIAEVCLILLLCAIFYLLALWQYKRDQQRKANERTIIDTIISRSKIILGFYQVVGEFFESLHDVSWVGGLQVIGEIISYMELNVLRVIVRPQCYDKNFSFNPKVEFVIGLSLPVLIIVIALFCYFVKKCYMMYKSRSCNHPLSARGDLLKLKSKLTTLVMVLLFIMYPPICTVIFQLLPRACKEFCLDHQSKYCFHLLRSDYDIDCASLLVYHYAAYCAVSLYVVSYPCVLLYLLRKHCSIKSQTLPDTRVFETEQRLDEQSPLLNELPPVHSAVPRWLNFLCENYKPQYWYWEILELARKITQTFLITLLGWEDKITMLLTIGISVMFLTLHARFWPMKDTFDQRLQMFSLTAIFINVVVAALQVPSGYVGAINVFLIILNVLVLVIIAGEIVFALVRHLRRMSPYRVLMAIKKSRIFYKKDTE